MASQTIRDRTFEDRATEQFRVRMRPKAIALYAKLFPGWEFIDLRANGERGHILDEEYGIDAEIRCPGSCSLTLQEKFRDYKHLIEYGDFTQGYMTRYHTPDVAEGEWFKLNTALYFYGWADDEESEFVKWIMLDVFTYKLLAVHAGGLDRLGGRNSLRQNRRWGQTAFYPIQLDALKPAIVASSDEMLIGRTGFLPTPQQ